MHTNKVNCFIVIFSILLIFAFAYANSFRPDYAIKNVRDKRDAVKCKKTCTSSGFFCFTSTQGAEPICTSIVQ
ncbi:hypothetical protein C2G38_2082009 [Gigaspora rosea]|uniref:Uncharacterized protein n=1 Tax=Gigaspora rosea TaxID=44941 RepID=A0A397VD41_9GLOM|nr:hypothetical protein C2G38_2082009 [Gigaspora rosea]